MRVDVGHQCGAIEHLHALTIGELVEVLASQPARQRGEVARAVGLRVRRDVPNARVAQLLRARLRSVDGVRGHSAAVALTDGLRTPVLGVLGDDPSEIAADLRAGLAGPLGGVPRPLLAALFALLNEANAFEPGVYADLVEVLSDADMSGPITTPGPSAGRADETRSEGGDQATSDATDPTSAEFAGHAPPPASGALDKLVTYALVDEHASGSAASQATAAVAELLELDPTRLGSWRLVGMAETLASTSLNRSPPTRIAARHRLRGTLRALVHLGDEHQLATAVAEGSRELGEVVDDIVGDINAADADIVAPVVVATLRTDLPRGRELLPRIGRPVPGWQTIVGAARRAAAGGDAKPSDSIALLRTLDEMLMAWTPGLSAGDAGAIEQAAAEIAVDRVTAQRCAGDFVGAASVAAAIDPTALTEPARRRWHDEVALCAARVASLDSITFAPPDQVAPRAERSLIEQADKIEAAVASGTGLPGHLLAAAASAASADSDSVVTHLTAASTHLHRITTPIPETPPDSSDAEAFDRLRATVAFHLALHQLRLLDPALLDSAQTQILDALDAGYEASPAELLSAAVALDAHDCALAVELLGRLLAGTPHHPEALDLLGRMAERGVPRAAALAVDIATSSGLAYTLRFALLDAALTGAACGGQTTDTERLADAMESVVSRAAAQELDRRWAARLGADDTLRSALGADAAELLRLDVLRRTGELPEAGAAARSLLYRTLSGHTDGLDPTDLLELVEMCDPAAPDLPALAALVSGANRRDATPTADRMLQPADTSCPSATHGGAARSTVTTQSPVSVLFVGGNEVQARMRGPVEAAIKDRYETAVTVEWFLTGWQQNWEPTAKLIEERFESADAMVLMTFMRTLLGRRLRRFAGQAGLPWVACTGHGRASLERAIARAVELACRHQAAPA